MKKKVLLITLVVALVAAVGAGSMLAYFSAEDTATNTFTVGNVKITLDEVVGYDADQKPVLAAATGHDYDLSLVPGRVFVKAPFITNTGANNAYVRLLVEVNNQAALDTIFADLQLGAADILQDYNTTNWTLNPLVNGEKFGIDSRIWEFRYNAILDSTDPDSFTEKLFEGFTVPDGLDGELETIEDLIITFTAQAIQADGFTDADEAFAALDAQQL